MTAAVHAAFSLSEEIKDFGAYAGFAAVLGLAVLSMLYFAQARELKRLRDWAGRAPERAAELEARVQAEATKRVVAEPLQPRPAQAGSAAAPATAATPAGQAAAAAPAATGGAAAAATAAGAAKAPAPPPGNGGAAPGAVPAAKPGAPAPATPGALQPATAGASGEAAAPGAPAGQPAGAGQPGAPVPAGTSGTPAAMPAASAQPGAPAQPAAPGQPGAPAQPGGPAAKAPAPGQPGAPAATASGAPSTPAAKPGAPTPAPPPATASAAAPAAPRAPVTVDPEHDATDRADSARPYVRPAAPAPAQPLRASTPSVTLPPRTPAGATARRRRATESITGGDGGPSPIRRNLAIVGGVLAMVVVAVVLVTGLSGSDEPTEPANQIAPNTTTEPADGGSGAATGGSGAGRRPITRGDVTVAVLNGTTTTGLARAAGNRIQSSGYKLGVVTNAADQQRSATIVSYAPGHRAEALDVARIIKVGADAVQPIDQSTQVVAGQEAFVVVTVGADQNT